MLHHLVIASIFLLDNSNESSILKGLKLLNIAADLELIPALLHLAFIYKNGDLVNENIVMAAVYFKYAADKGDGTAMIEYGNFLQCVIEHKIEKIKIDEYVQKTKNITQNINIFNNYLYVE